MPRDRLRLPPSGITGELGEWCRDVWRALVDIPTISRFSGASPNSSVTGLAGDVAVNVGSASTDSRVWVKGGSVTVPSQTGWVVLRTLA